MDDKQLQAIRERRKWLGMLFSEDCRKSKKTDLVSLQRVLFLLATRYLERPEWPGHDVPEGTKLLWELEWYSYYLKALGELAVAIQAAILASRITPRSNMSRVPLAHEELRPWLELDLKAAIDEASKASLKNGLPDTTPDSGWPDAAAMPSGVFVALGDVAKWADAEGIAMPDDLAALIQEHEGKQNTPAKPLPNGCKVNGTPQWWNTEYDIPALAQSIAAVAEAAGESTTWNAIHPKITTRIGLCENDTNGKRRPAPPAAIKKHLTAWKYTPE